MNKTRSIFNVKGMVLEFVASNKASSLGELTKVLGVNYGGRRIATLDRTNLVWSSAEDIFEKIHGFKGTKGDVSEIHSEMLTFEA
jgi:hypothetical protein